MTNLSLSFSDLCCRSTLRLALALGVAVLVVGCEAPAEKVAPADDTSSADTGTDSTGGDVTEDTAPDGADAAPDTAVDTGTAPSCDEQLGLLPSTDCGCGGQLICRDQAAAPVCVGALPENACGGCGGIAVEIGAGCGLCGDGVWTCDVSNPDVPSCVGATPQNSCGGCTALPGIEGDSCSADGFFLCATEDELVCVGPGQNACGGFAALGEALGGPCGECGAGRFVCDGVDAVRCEEAAEPRNACGGCGTLPNRVGDACGDCDGTWACDPSNNDGLVCSQTRNVCGSCGSPGAGGLGEACTGGRLVCGVDGQLSCESNDRNLCGGTAALSDDPGTGCGSCGGVNICAGPDRVVCIGSSPVNGCGGCGFLPGFPGTFCGVDHTWECNGDGTMACEQTTASVVVSDAVGGRAEVDGGQVTLPSGAVAEPIRITIRIRNGLVIPGYQLTSPVLEFGPSGTEFAQPLEVQIISDDAPASDMVWSNRAAEGGGYSEVPGATVAGDALVGEVYHFSVGFTGIPIPDTELCGDGTDNDGDGLTDCEDSDCALVAGCAVSDTELDCTNGIDDDGDLLTDCDDSDCVGGPGCGEPLVELCDNSLDDDGDGMTDCADADCASAINCSGGLTEVCDDGIDNNADGWVDCADADCAADPSCGPPDTDAGGLCSGVICSGGEACFEVSSGDGVPAAVCRVPCASVVDCPSGFTCSPEGCVASGGGTDAGADAGADAGPGAGACLNPADQAAYGSTGLLAQQQVCEANCVSDADPAQCMATCMVEDAGLSPECADCHGARVACVLTDCLAVCLADESGILCDACVAATCGVAFAACAGAGGVETDCSDGLDNNLDGRADCADSACAAGINCGGGEPTEVCGDRLDNDRNGLTDCEDPYCVALDPTCSASCGAGCSPGTSCVSGVCVPLGNVETYCDDGLDDDGDNLVDCLDADCASAAACTNITGACSNETDGNVFYGGTYVNAFNCIPRAPFQEPLVAPCVTAQTGLSTGCTDCMAAYIICVASSADDNPCIQAVRDCSGIPFVVGEICGNGVDDDGNRQVDCADSDCRTAPECQAEAVAEVCTDGTDNDGDSAIDCIDRDCAVACVGVPENCSDGFDDNGNGVRDCYETSCASDPSCTEEICGNGLDDNGNGSTDCADSACVGAIGCIESLCGDGLDDDGDGAVDCADADCFDQLSEDADDGSVPSDWTTSAATATTAAWGFTTVGALAGNSLRSGVIPDSGVSELTIPSPNRGAGRLSFWWKTDTERSYDFFSVLFGGTLTWTRQSGVNAWSQATLTVPANTPSVTFRYVKDGSQASGADAVWIDNIEWTAGEQVCFPEVCANGTDDNLDGLVDCADADCAVAVGCIETQCNDYLDDDEDGAFDCLDADCAGSAQCQEDCDDGVDNDGDGLPDCFDVACRGSAACPVQSCLGVADTGTVAPYNGYGYGYAATSCAPGEGCALAVPGEAFTYSAWAGQQLYRGVCAPELATGAACRVDGATGYCGDGTHGAGCLAGLCRGNEVPSYYAQYGYCGTGRTSVSALGADGSVYFYCAPDAIAAAPGEACGDGVGKYCEGDGVCASTTTLAVTRDAGVCVLERNAPSQCAAGSEWRAEWNDSSGRHGLCLPVVGEGAPCGLVQQCDVAAGLTCGDAGVCRPVVVGEGCASAAALTLNESGIGPDYFAVDRLEGQTAANESLNCSGTVGPEKVYFYTAVAPTRLRIEVGSLDGNGPTLSWYARTSTCDDIFAEATCASASATPTEGTVDLAAGQTAYLVVDSEVRSAGGDNASAEFFVAVSEVPLSSEGESCVSAVCATGLNCATTGFCAIADCGDGVRDTAEGCDDGNTSGGDGCATDCTIESYPEVEPNDTVPTANLVTNAQRISGYSSYENDVFCFPLAAGGGRLTLRAEADIVVDGSWLYAGQSRIKSFASSQGCFTIYGYNVGYQVDVAIDPFEALPSGAACGPVLATGAFCADISGAPAVCREASSRLHRGTCERSTCGDGYVDVATGESCDDGNTTSLDGCSATCSQETYAEVEPNNGTLTARSLGGYRLVSGVISSTTDYDYYKITLAKRSHLEFTVSSSAFGNYSGTLGLQVLNASSTAIFNGVMDNYYGQSGAREGSLGSSGYLSRAASLSFLEAGTYTIRVAAAATATGSYLLSVRGVPTSSATDGAACDPFSYRPCDDGFECSVQSRTCEAPVCGNGTPTADEECDDGNAVSGDGCSATCLLETYAPSVLSSDSRNPTSIDGLGARFTFSDGSTARAVGFDYFGGDRYISVALEAPTRLRLLNVYGSLRIFDSESVSPYAASGVQISKETSYVSVAYPDWFAAGTTPVAATDWNCDGATADGLCTDIDGGGDCMDCGARFGVGLPTIYGKDVVLPPGRYTVELQSYDGGRPSWVFLGQGSGESGPVSSLLGDGAP